MTRVQLSLLAPFFVRGRSSYRSSTPDRQSGVPARAFFVSCVCWGGGRKHGGNSRTPLQSLRWRSQDSKASACKADRGPRRTRVSFGGVESRSSGVQFSPPPPEFVLV